MKECPHCTVFLFDDQEYCYECMSPLQDLNSKEAGTPVICIEVVVGEEFSYETHLRKVEGALLSVGSARENAIVIPQPEVREHQLDIFFSQGHLWVENKGGDTDTAEAIESDNAAGTMDTSYAQLNGMSLNGIRSVHPGAHITIGNTQLSLGCLQK